MTILKNHKSLVVFSVGIVLVSLSVIIAKPSLVYPASAITWTPKQVAGEVALGKSKTQTVTFKSVEALSNVALRVVPELQPYIKVTPSSFPSISAGTSVSITVTFSASTTAPLRTFSGTVHLVDASGKSQKTYSTPLPVTLLITVVPLPPDPGEAGKATLEGIDSDRDGVRDDVQRYIALTYPNSEKTRAALMQSAKTSQAVILGVNEASTSYLRTLEELHADECLDYVHGVKDARVISDELLAQILNTQARSKAYITAGEHFVGHTYKLPPLSEKKSFCGFDPDTMRN